MTDQPNIDLVDEILAIDTVLMVATSEEGNPELYRTAAQMIEILSDAIRPKEVSKTTKTPKVVYTDAFEELMADKPPEVVHGKNRQLTHAERYLSEYLYRLDLSLNDHSGIRNHPVPQLGELLDCIQNWNDGAVMSTQYVSNAVNFGNADIAERIKAERAKVINPEVIAALNTHAAKVAKKVPLPKSNMFNRYD